MANDERCVCCGEIIPEGRMVCPNCEEGSKAKRLIDANEIEDLFYKQVEWGATDLMDAFDDALQDAQTVDAVEVVHGRWEDEYGGKFANPRYRCSVCKEKALYRNERDCLGGWHEVQALTDYCPYCGADMRERSTNV